LSQLIHKSTYKPVTQYEMSENKIQGFPYKYIYTIITRIEFLVDL